jgi:hypothetical protein
LADPLCILEADLPQRVLQNLKKDAALNMLSGDPIAGFVVVLPKFSKGLSGSRLNIQPHSTSRFGSCAFDLAERLGLLSNLSNEILGEVETIPLRDLVHNSVTYCARISRHFLVWLISEHVQELWQLGDRTYISTDIGQFTLYAHEGRSLVHFDGSIRTSTTTVIPGQSLEDIRRIANGENKNESGTWKKQRNKFDFAIICKSLPPVVRYLRTNDIEEWRFLGIFADILGGVVRSIVQTVAAPASFAAALAKNWLEPGNLREGTRDSATVSVRLAVFTQAAILAFRRTIDNLEDRGR